MSTYPDVTLLSHTADVGFEIRAPSLEALFRAAAVTTMELVYGQKPTGDGSERTVDLTADDLPTMLRSWLRDLLWWSEVEGVATCDILSIDVGDEALTAKVVGTDSAPEPIREIKGVTLHRLVVEPRKRGWFCRVIFDV